MIGSSPLTEEQQDWYQERFGKRYLTVQESVVRPSRRVRRHGPRTEAEARVFDWQMDALRALQKARLTVAD